MAGSCGWKKDAGWVNPLGAGGPIRLEKHPVMDFFSRHCSNILNVSHTWIAQIGGPYEDKLMSMPAGDRHTGQVPGGWGKRKRLTFLILSQHNIRKRNAFAFGVTPLKITFAIKKCRKCAFKSTLKSFKDMSVGRKVGDRSQEGRLMRREGRGRFRDSFWE